METLERKTVSEDGFDLCVSCGTKTKYKTETSINVRENYVEGAGQLCTDCYVGAFIPEIGANILGVHLT